MRLSKKRVVLVVAIMAATSWFVMSLIKRSVRAEVAEAANTFLKSWRSGDYPGAYALMAETYHTQHSLQAFTNDRTMQLFVEMTFPNSQPRTVDANKNTELDGWHYALVSEFSSSFLGIRSVVGECYVVRRGPMGWRFTGEVEYVSD